jgi:hypothetical protein
MSLYTLTKDNMLPSSRVPGDLKIEESTNIELLACMATISVGDVVSRLANDHVAYVAYMKGIPAAFGWMARGTALIGELDHRLVLPVGNRYLWNFRTMEPFRGLGVYPALLQHIVRQELDKASRFWIIHAPENKASLSGIRKAGFQYVGKLYIRQRRTVIEATRQARLNRKLLEAMHIGISQTEPASCWNCSSPYLKKRKPECCCTAPGEVCTINNLHSLAMSI